jgi:Tol biopolymer transport system component
MQLRVVARHAWYGVGIALGILAGAGIAHAQAAGGSPPFLGFTPPPQSTINYNGANGLVGALASASILVEPFKGFGSGPDATTTLDCEIFQDADVFGPPPDTLTFEGAAAVAQTINLTCTRQLEDQSAFMRCTEMRGKFRGSHDFFLECPVGTEPSGVSLTISPDRITQSGVVEVNFNPVNASGCVVTSSQPGTTFQTVGTNKLSATVTVGTAPRNEVFTAACTAPSQQQVIATATLAVGVAAPPAQPPVVQASAPPGVTANGASTHIALSDGARFVAFESAASNLVAGDDNGQLDVFLRNSSNGQITRASVETGGQPGAASGEANISRDGSIVVFTTGTAVTAAAGSQAKTFLNGQVCLNNLAANQQQCVSKSPGGQPGNGSSTQPSTSGDGKQVVYTSTSTNLTAAADGNGAVADVFLTDTVSSQTKAISVTEAGASGNAPASGPRISCNGKHIVFESTFPFGAGTIQPGVKNIYAASATLPGKRLVSAGLASAGANGDSLNAAIADDGLTIAFESAASNLVAGDTNGVKDVFIADLTTGAIKRVSTSAAGVQADGESRNPRMSCDGAFLTFDSDASNMVVGDGNGSTDTFMLSKGTGSLALMSQSNGTAANGQSANGVVSPDGSAIGFDSNATSLGGDPQRDVFAGVNPFASQNYTGAWFDPAQAGHGIFLDQLPDGRLVAWWFTFDPSGQPAWFGGTGPLLGTTATIDIVRTTGTSFMPNFRPIEIVNNPIGTLRFTFTGCSAGRVDFTLDNTFQTGFMNLTRLSAPVGVNCTGTVGTAVKSVSSPHAWTGSPFEAIAPKAVEPADGPIASVTGAWFDPAQSGQGLFMENLGDGRLLAWWFTFAPEGGQAWFGGVGSITDGSHAQIQVARTTGGRWIPNFNPANVVNTPLGTLNITIDNCSGGNVAYDLQQGFGQGTLPITPLLRAVGTACAD